MSSYFFRRNSHLIIIKFKSVLCHFWLHILCRIYSAVAVFTDSGSWQTGHLLEYLVTLLFVLLLDYILIFIHENSLRIRFKECYSSGDCVCFCRGNSVATNSGSLYTKFSVWYFADRTVNMMSPPQILLLSLCYEFLGWRSFFPFPSCCMKHHRSVRYYLSLRFIFSTCTENTPWFYTGSLM